MYNIYIFKLSVNMDGAGIAAVFDVPFAAVLQYLKRIFGNDEYNAATRCII